MVFCSLSASETFFRKPILFSGRYDHKWRATKGNHTLITKTHDDKLKIIVLIVWPSFIIGWNTVTCLTRKAEKHPHVIKWKILFTHQIPYRSKKFALNFRLNCHHSWKNTSLMGHANTFLPKFFVALNFGHQW